MARQLMETRMVRSGAVSASFATYMLIPFHPNVVANMLRHCCERCALTRLERHKYCVARSPERCFSLQICFALLRPVFLCFAIELLLSPLSPLQHPPVFQQSDSHHQLYHLPPGSHAMPRQAAPSANFVHFLQQNDVVGQPLSEAVLEDLATEFSSFHSSCQLDLKEQLLFAHFPSKQICILRYRVTEIVHVLACVGCQKKEV